MDIRPAKEADLTEIVNIYNQSIPSRLATADTESVTVESRLDWYHNRSYNRPLWVATDQAKILGWLSLQNFYGRPAYAHTAEVSIYVATQYHRQGIGSKLLGQAIASCPQLQLTTLLGFVFAHNHPSLHLFTRYGFAQWGHLPNVAVLAQSDRPTLKDTPANISFKTPSDQGKALQRSLIILGLSI
jgi:L-amino acid N-acyltransferase YncA